LCRKHSIWDIESGKAYRFPIDLRPNNKDLFWSRIQGYRGNEWYVLRKSQILGWIIHRINTQFIFSIGWHGILEKIHWFQLLFVHKRRLCLFWWVRLRNYINDQNSQKNESLYKENILTAFRLMFMIYSSFSLSGLVSLKCK